ncbi:hypothetical protein [Pseudomonas simiae]|uniref:hypothetical protein n=1 Tax=Pseudomonas simiae TaxID=321846 RepID=UPI0006460B06|nr:hypothetical protein [Pseudomonas simiae]MCF5189866.1 hypothetical protein [Pseudomonas simiae]MCF5348353.1 hypothetical protein [Pseudomonas simiae]
MLAPVIFISLRCTDVATAKRSWWEQTRTSGDANQYLFQIFFHWNIFSIKLVQGHSHHSASFQQATPAVMPRYFFAPTL